MLQDGKSDALEREAAKEEHEAKKGAEGHNDISAAQDPVAGCGSEAIAQLKESFRGLLYVVLLSGQPQLHLPNLEC